LATVLAVGAAVLLTATPAHAAPPANDTIEGAIAIGSLPFTTTLDTTQATTDAVDADLNQLCGAPATDASVWFSYTPAEDGAVVMSVEESSYTAGILVAIGAPGSLELIACGPSAVGVPVTTGTTYYFMAIDDQADGTGNGGTLVVNAQIAPPPPEITLTVNRFGTFDDTGAASVYGTISCTGEVEFSFLSVELTQPVGRGAVFGFADIEITCDGTVRPWTAVVDPIIGTRFAGGRATAVTFSVACGPFFCGESFLERQIRLRRA
jgi:hypothetical protein